MAEWFVKAVPENPASRRKLRIAAGAGVAAVALVGSLWGNLSSGSGDVVVDTSPTGASVAPPAATLVVQVVGAVAKPGVYEVPVDSRVMDAVTMAGGMTAKADPASLNLARIVQDGEQIIVGSGGRSSSGASAQRSTVNINTATAADFETLPRIGATLAERIVAYRDDNGPFTTIDSLLEVPGIGKLTLAGFRDKITL